MNTEQNKFDQETDISKSQSAQEPTAEQNIDQPGGEFGQTEGGEFQGQTETLNKPETDIEGTEGESGFVGQQGETDTSSELIEDDETQAPDGQ